MPSRLIVIILGIALLSAPVAASPTAIGQGYGFLASEGNAESSAINPSGLHSLQNDIFAIAFTGPSFGLAEAFTVLKTSFKSLPFGLGCSFLSPELQRIYAAVPFGFPKLPWLNLAPVLSIDREYHPAANDRFGVGLGAGALLVFPADKKDQHLDFSVGISGINLFTWNQFTTTDRIADRTLLCGLRLETFIHELILNTGGSWDFDVKKVSRAYDWSAGLEYGGIGRIKIEDVLLGEPRFGAVRYARSTAAFISWTLRSHTFTLSYLTGDKGDSFEIGYRLRAMSRPVAPAPKKHPKAKRKATAADLERQKNLLNEGLQLYKAKQYDEAVATWERSIRIEPDNETANEARGYIEKVTELLKGIEE
jgi:hypothetical protein